VTVKLRALIYVCYPYELMSSVILSCTSYCDFHLEDHM